MLHRLERLSFLIKHNMAFLLSTRQCYLTYEVIPGSHYILVMCCILMNC